MNWKVIYVKSRREEHIASMLEKIGVIVYCPLVTEVRQWSDRKKKVRVALIPSYIFVQLEEKEREIVFEVPGVIRYLFWLGKPAIVRDTEITILKNWLSGGAVEASVAKLEPGDRMEIKTGLFKNKTGIVQEINKNRIQLLLLDLDMKITINRK